MFHCNSGRTTYYILDRNNQYHHFQPMYSSQVHLQDRYKPNSSVSTPYACHHRGNEFHGSTQAYDKLPIVMEYARCVEV